MTQKKAKQSEVHAKQCDATPGMERHNDAKQSRAKQHKAKQRKANKSKSKSKNKSKSKTKQCNTK